MKLNLIGRCRRIAQLALKVNFPVLMKGTDEFAVICSNCGGMDRLSVDFVALKMSTE